eukprot:8138664-Lingulodinium_polyedra.AAC.1
MGQWLRPDPSQQDFGSNFIGANAIPNKPMGETRPIRGLAATQGLAHKRSNAAQGGVQRCGQDLRRL